MSENSDSAQDEVSELFIDKKVQKNMWVNVNNLRVRFEPNLNAKVVTHLNYNDAVQWTGVSTKSQITVKLSGKEVTGPFLKIKYNQNSEGWVFSGALSETKLSTYWEEAGCPRGEPVPHINSEKFPDAGFKIDYEKGTAEEEIELNEELRLQVVQAGCEYVNYTYKIYIKSMPENIDLYDATYWYPRAVEILKLVKSKKAIDDIGNAIEVLQGYIDKDNLEFENAITENNPQELSPVFMVYEPKRDGSGVLLEVSKAIGPL